jgi:hypothetical protein
MSTLVTEPELVYQFTSQSLKEDSEQGVAMTGHRVMWILADSSVRIARCA